MGPDVFVPSQGCPVEDSGCVSAVNLAGNAGEALGLALGLGLLLGLLLCLISAWRD